MIYLAAACAFLAVCGILLMLVEVALDSLALLREWARER